VLFSSKSVVVIENPGGRTHDEMTHTKVLKILIEMGHKRMFVVEYGFLLKFELEDNFLLTWENDA
jgi:hypothetical protein